MRGRETTTLGAVLSPFASSSSALESSHRCCMVNKSFTDIHGWVRTAQSTAAPARSYRPRPAATACRSAKLFMW